MWKLKTKKGIVIRYGNREPGTYLSRERGVGVPGPARGGPGPARMVGVRRAQ